MDVVEAIPVVVEAGVDVVALGLPVPFHLSASAREYEMNAFVRLSREQAGVVTHEGLVHGSWPMVCIMRTRWMFSGLQVTMPKLPPVAPTCGESTSVEPWVTNCEQVFSWSTYSCG